MDCIFFGLTAVCLFVLRRHKVEDQKSISFRVPGHPWVTLLFIAANWLIVISTFAHDPRRSLVGLAIALAGLPVYWFWRARP
jgi:APA family basic amino acid/polyamine antiporter